MPLFKRYIGIDYSGAQSPEQCIPGLCVYIAESHVGSPEVEPPPIKRRHWTRRGLTDYLIKLLKETSTTIIGIDHGFSFPEEYFESHGIEKSWDIFLDDFCKHWPTDREGVSVRDIRRGVCGNCAARQGDTKWLRTAEKHVPGTQSIFRFDCQGQVATSTHAGIPWLRRIRKELGDAVHFWPFDGWTPRDGSHVIAEVYPSVFRRRYPAEGRTPDQQDAYATCRWLQEMDHFGYLPRFFDPPLKPEEKSVAAFEGWILGVM